MFKSFVKIISMIALSVLISARGTAATLVPRATADLLEPTTPPIYARPTAATGTLTPIPPVSLERVTALDLPDSFVNTILFSPDESLLASAGDDGTVRLWDMETGVNFKTFRVPGRELGAAAFSPDGALLAFSIWGEGVQVWAVTP